MISGKVWMFGDDINTDLMLPTAHMYSPKEIQAQHVFEANRPGWVKLVGKGDFVFGGKNFGTGSSRPAPLAMTTLGIGCVVAETFNPLFFRNCVSFGLQALECPGVTAAFQEGDIAEISLAEAKVRNTRTGQTLPGVAIPEALLSLMAGGGIFPLLESEGLIGPAPAEAAGAAQGG
ncbi:MAG TPA: 3-isopropylmalate dehydratase [Dongiaceae bacterium]|jgi:3-isopropylmalate/(R)-2-methylmalate dehydratase small subunit|nr:3-isopropylmalate dehydratase [Dongiaceae bacterium]